MKRSSPESSRGSCIKKDFAGDFANQLSDPALCEKIRTLGTKDSCYFNMATRLRDSLYCDKITNINQKQNCQQNIQSGVEKPMPVKPI